MADRISDTSVTVLLSGESGTGKELFARRIHTGSHRSEANFVAVNCSEIPATLADSVLFGHERGAFTGAERLHRGHFEQARGGTLFLDEIAEFEPTLQAKLLRVMEQRSVTRVGGEQPLPIDVRILAATNRDLAVEMREGRFREDLFYRVARISINLPPLRKRGNDIVILARHFVRSYACAYGRPAEDLSPDALEQLRAHSWPGNVRELSGVIERAVLLGECRTIGAEDLVIDRAAPEPAAPVSHPDHGLEGSDEPATIDELVKRHVIRVFADTGQDMTTAAGILGIHRNTLRNKLREYRMHSTHKKSASHTISGRDAQKSGG